MQDSMWSREDAATDEARANYEDFWRAAADETVLICTVCGGIISARFASAHRRGCSRVSS